MPTERIKIKEVKEGKYPKIYAVGAKSAFALEPASLVSIFKAEQEYDVEYKVVPVSYAGKQWGQNTIIQAQLVKAPSYIEQNQAISRDKTIERLSDRKTAQIAKCCALNNSCTMALAYATLHKGNPVFDILTFQHTKYREFLAELGGEMQPEMENDGIEPAEIAG